MMNCTNTAKRLMNRPERNTQPVRRQSSTGVHSRLHVSLAQKVFAEEDRDDDLVTRILD